jgi:hypothetical protein
MLTGIDPQTGWLPEDIMQGILYPNDATGRGDGYVSYVVKPKTGLPSGTQITNKATIVFDWNDPIDTPLVLNTLDAGTPVSAVAALPVTVRSPQFQVAWTGQDEANGSGIAHYDVFVSTDGGPFALWLDNTTATSATFTGQDDHTYAFYSVATDNVGHTEAAPTTPDATVRIDVLPTVVNVRVQGSVWSPAFPLAEGYSLPGDTRPLPWINVDTLRIVFSEDVNITAGNLSLRGVSVSEYAGSFTYDPATFTATLTLPQAIGADKLLLDVRGVTDKAGNALDGEWPGSTPGFPSGDGAAGGDFSFRFDVLPGDVNQDGAVNASDVAAVRGAQGSTPVFGAYAAVYDCNGDRIVGSTDLIKVRNRQGTQLPEGEPALPLGSSLTNVAALIASSAVQAADFSGSLSDVSAPNTLPQAPETAASKEALVAESGVHPGGSSEPALPSLPNSPSAVQTHTATSGQLPSTTPLAARAVDAVLASWREALPFSLREDRDSPQVVSANREYWWAASYALAEWGRESNRFAWDFGTATPKRRGLAFASPFADPDWVAVEQFPPADGGKPLV